MFDESFRWFIGGLICLGSLGSGLGGLVVGLGGLVGGSGYIKGGLGGLMSCLDCYGLFKRFR